MNSRERWLQLATRDGETVAIRVVDVARARYLRLSLGRDGPRLSKPRWLPMHEAAAFLDQKRDWLEARLHERQQRVGSVRLPNLQIGACGQIPLRGQTVTMRVVAGPRPLLVPTAEALILQWPEQRPPAAKLLGGLLRGLLDTQMRTDIAGLLTGYTPRLGRAPTRITLRPLQSIWGSLSARDHMSLDLALILAPPTLLEYVLVHELCHLFERNHGPRFWARVADLLPDYRERQRQLRAEGDGYKSDLGILLAAGASRSIVPGVEPAALASGPLGD